MDASLLLQLVQTGNASGGLLRDALEVFVELGEAVVVLLDALADERPELELVLAHAAVGVGQGAVLLELLLGLEAEEEEDGGVASVVDDEVGTLAVLPGEGVEGALPVLGTGLALPGENLSGSGLDDGGGGLVLGREDVAGAPPDAGSEAVEGLDEGGGLDGHVEGAGDAGILEGLVGAVLLPDGHQSGHLHLGEAQFLPSPVSETDVSNLRVVLHCSTIM